MHGDSALAALPKVPAQATGDKSSGTAKGISEEQMVSEPEQPGDQQSSRAAGLEPNGSTDNGGRDSHAYVTVTLRMQNGGKARRGSCILMRAGVDTSPPSKDGQDVAAGKLASQALSTGKRAETMFKRPAAGYACQSCVPQHSQGSSKAHRASVSQPDTAARPVPDAPGNNGAAAANDVQATAGATAAAFAAGSCTMNKAGCLLGYVTCGWQPGMPGSCPAQGAVKLHCFNIREQADVWVWDYRSGLLHSAVAERLFL